MNVPNDQELEALFRRLHLANAPRIFRALCQRAEEENWAYRDLIAVLFAEEVAHRQNTRLKRLAGQANFPFLRTIDEFDFTFQSTLRLTVIGSYLSPDFVTEGRCLILSGKTGRGKSHLAIAIAYRAIQNGFDALFCTAAHLIDELSAASRTGKFREALAGYVRPHVLVIDEVGYLTYGNDAANVLFHVVNERCLKKRPMIFTTNKALSRWGQVLHDDDLAETITDRVLEHGRHIKLDGVSYRTKHLSVDAAGAEEASDQPAIVSGIKPAEFPEPTGCSACRARPSLRTSRR